MLKESFTQGMKAQVYLGQNYFEIKATYFYQSIWQKFKRAIASSASEDVTKWAFQYVAQ